MEQPIEVSAKTVEEAIELALKQLGARRDEVEVEVLSRGKPGFLGFGGELARVRLIRSSALERDTVTRPIVPLRPVPEPQEAPPEPVERVLPIQRPPPQRRLVPEAPPPSPEQVEGVQQAVDRLLGLMQVQARSAKGPSPKESPSTPVIELTGEDAGLLIGRGGETLRALQLLANLMVAKEGARTSPVLIDVEGYRERRSEVLRNLALRIADRVATTGRPFTLEPMSAYERRLIHVSLADDPRVTTESVGEAEERKVNIQPRQAAAQQGPPRPTRGEKPAEGAPSQPRPRPSSRNRGLSEGGQALRGLTGVPF